jgi:hypothetical protein
VDVRRVRVFEHEPSARADFANGERLNLDVEPIKEAIQINHRCKP